MALNICFINPPIREWALPNVPPLGLLILSSRLRANGHKATILDLNGLRLSKAQIEEKIDTMKFDLIGITGLITQWNYIKWLSQVTKKYHPDVPLIAGGPVVSNAPDLFSKHMPNIDAIVVGEGEQAILDVAQDVERGAFTSKRNIILFTQTITSPLKHSAINKELFNIEKPVYQSNILKHLDDSPFPDFDNLQTLSVYLRNPVGALNKRKWIDGAAKETVNNLCIVTTRSCVFRCRFCQPRYLGLTPRSFSIAKIISEIRMLIEKYGIKYIHFCDEITFFSKNRAVEFAKEMIRQNLHHVVKWGAPTRIDTQDSNSLALLAKAGCIHLGLGVESLSPAILKAMDKYTQIKGGVLRVIENIRIARELIEDIDTTFVIGFPGETRNTIIETIQNMARIGPDFKPNVVFFATPYPQTWLWNYAVQKEYIKDPVNYIESLGENSSNLLINFTNMPDTELRDWKKQMESASLDKQNVLQ